MLRPLPVAGQGSPPPSSIVHCRQYGVSPPAQDLFDDVHAKLRTGKPGFHHARYKVYENHFHNILARGEGEVGSSQPSRASLLSTGYS